MSPWRFCLAAALSIPVGAELVQLAHRAAIPGEAAGGQPTAVKVAQRVLAARNSEPEGRLVALLDVDLAPGPAPRHVEPPRNGSGGASLTNATAGEQRVTGVEIRRLSDGARLKVALPGGEWIRNAHFTADARHLVLESVHADGIHLHLVETRGGAVASISAAALSDAWGEPCDWDHASGRLLCKLALPRAGSLASSPLVQLALLDLKTRGWQRVGAPGRYEFASLAPGGEFVFVARPDGDRASAGIPGISQPCALEIWTTAGAPVRRLTGLAGTPKRPPMARWDPGKPARLAWIGARPGDAFGQSVYVIEPPSDLPKQLFETVGTVEALSWSGDGSLFITEAVPGEHGKLITWGLAGGAERPRKIWDRDKRF